jgi:hypothetical protein
MKRNVKVLIWLACGMVFCAVSRAVDGQNAPSSNAANLDALRQKMTLQNRLQLMKKLHSDGSRIGLSNGMQPLPASTPGTAGHAPTNPIPPNDNTDASNPYGSIAARNVFALNPVPPPAPPPDPNAIPPPKITLTGITTIFGPAEALYKVAAYVKEGKQMPEQSYILTEGEAQDDVEVTMIDTQKDIVTFDNHGQAQVIPLANGVATGGNSAPSAPSGQPGFIRRFGGNFPRPGGGPGPGNFQPRSGGSYNGGGYNNPNGNNFTPAGQLNNGGSSSPYNNAYNDNASSQQTLSPDDQAALIAAQHAEAANNPNSRIPPNIFPPTAYDSEAGVPASDQSQTSQSQTGQSGQGPTLSPDKIARLQAQEAAMGMGPGPAP